MRIGFIGAGKVGFTFGRYIAEKRELVRENGWSIVPGGWWIF